MLVILAAAVLFGLWKGLAWQVAMLAAIFVSYFVSANFSGVVAGYISADAPWNRFLAMFILYVGTSLAIWVAFGFVRKSIDKMQLESFDRQIGAIVGGVTGATLCVVITLFAVTLLGEKTRKAVCESKSGYYIAKGLDQLSAVVPSQYHEMVAPYVDNLNQALDEHGNNPEGESFEGTLTTREPGSVTTGNQYTGTWHTPEKDAEFDLEKAAKALLEKAANNSINRK